VVLVRINGVGRGCFQENTEEALEFVIRWPSAKFFKKFFKKKFFKKSQGNLGPQKALV
jgi:hypothetical protein